MGQGRVGDLNPGVYYQFLAFLPFPRRGSVTASMRTYLEGKISDELSSVVVESSLTSKSCTRAGSRS